MSKVTVVSPMISALTRQRDQISAERRRLPMVQVEKEYVFEGEGGEATLPDLLAGKDIAFAAIAGGRWESLDRWRQGRDWTFPFFSSYGTDFNYDFHVSLDAAKAPVEYNYRNSDELAGAGLSAEMLTGDFPGNSVFLRDGDTVYHTYSAYARGLDQLFPAVHFYDLTPYGRQEEWEDSPAGWPQQPTYG